MARTKKPVKAASQFKTIELSAMPSPRTPADYPEIERALEFAQTLKNRAVIAFEGSLKDSARFRMATHKLLVKTKRAAFYRCTVRKGQVFIWRASDPVV